MSEELHCMLWSELSSLTRSRSSDVQMLLLSQFLQFEQKRNDKHSSNGKYCNFSWWSSKYKKPHGNLIVFLTQSPVGLEISTRYFSPISQKRLTKIMVTKEYWPLVFFAICQILPLLCYGTLKFYHEPCARCKEQPFVEWNGWKFGPPG